MLSKNSDSFIKPVIVLYDRNSDAGHGETDTSHNLKKSKSILLDLTQDELRQLKETILFTKNKSHSPGAARPPQ